MKIKNILKSKLNKKRKNAFTIVELVVVIVVIGILSTITILGYGSWQKSIKETQIKSELAGAKTAMENWRSFNGRYPDNIEDTGYKPNSSGVEVTGGSTDNGETFIIEAKIVGVPRYIINNSSSIPSLASNVAQVSAGETHTCAIAFDAKAYCWGANTQGQLGNGNNTNSLVPVRVDMSGDLSGKSFKTISAGYYRTCAIASDDKAYCWGSNNGVLGDGGIANQNKPVAVKMQGLLDGKTVKSISAGGLVHGCLIASDDNAYCWGHNYSGSLGNSSYSSSSFPVPVKNSNALLGKTIKSITAGGFDNTCAVASDKKAYCWGKNDLGQVGDKTYINRNEPVAVDTSGVLNLDISSISAGEYHTCAIALDNYAYCWGYNQTGQLGSGSVETKVNYPVAVNKNSYVGKNIKNIEAGKDHTCAIASDNKAYCWGYNYYGQLGNNGAQGYYASNWNVPTAVSTSGVLSGKNLVSVSVGRNHSCSIDTDSKVYCWGDNSYYQIGDNTNITRKVPVSINLID